MGWWEGGGRVGQQKQTNKNMQVMQRGAPALSVKNMKTRRTTDRLSKNSGAEQIKLTDHRTR